MVIDNATVTGRPDEYEAAVRRLALRLRGQLIRPGEAEYDTARAVWHGSFDRYPALIVRPADVTDVVNAVNLAREYGMSVAVRSGGHSMVGHGTTDRGMVVDLSLMRKMSVDPKRLVARIEPGLTWGEVAQKAQEFGLALTSGDMASVGVGGLTLGGGIGWMVRKHGLTLDNLLSVDIVTADGRLLTASADENPDLFWALRGGGGNFGIVTAFEFRMHPVGMILGGAVMYPATEAKEILQTYAQYAAAAPDELTTMATVMYAPPLPFLPPEVHGQMIVSVMAVYAGDLEEGERVVAPLRALGTPIVDLIGPMPYPAMFEITREGTAKGLHHDVRTMYLSALDDGILDTILDHMPTSPSPRGMAQVRVLGGAMSRVPEEATAFAHRDAALMFTIVNGWEDSGASAPNRAWTERFWTAMRPYASGAYVNFLADEGEERIREAYKPATYKRLVAVKNRYDPTNFFHLNQNIKPTV